jgi:hypothetical protein
MAAGWCVPRRDPWFGIDFAVIWRMDRCRTYRDPKIIPEHGIPLDQAAKLHTHPGVIAGINAVCTERRPAMTIWRAPTGPECDHIVMALEEYIEFGDFERAPDDIYAWDADEVRL